MAGDIPVIPATQDAETLWWLVVVLGGSSFALSVILPLVVKPLLARWGVIDIPSGRSSHDQPTIRGMGVAVALAMVCVYTGAILSGLIEVDRSLAVAVLLMFTSAAALGWVEDYRGLSVTARLGSQLAIGSVGTGLMAMSLGVSLWWWPVGVLATVAYINIANFMDGINGISGMHGLAVGALYAWAGAVNQAWWMAAAGVVVAGAFAGFLPWNLSRATVFLGDVGSYVLGGAIIAIAIGAFLSGIYVEYLLPPLLVYLADTGVTLISRVQRGEIWYKPHRQHVYQRLTDAGLSHVGSALVVTVATVLVSVGSLVGLRSQGTGSILAGVLVILILGIYLTLPSLLTFIRSRNTINREA